MNGRVDEPSETPEVKLKSFDDFELTLGDIMRGERATKGKSLLDVQREIKIKAEYLAAIEESNLTAFETPGFIGGYVKSYARYLGMNSDWVYARFCQESGFSHVAGLEQQVVRRKGAAPLVRGSDASDAMLARSPISSAPSHGPFHGIEAGALGSLAVLLGLIGALGYGGWSVLQEIQRVTLAPVETPLSAVEAQATPEPSTIVNNAAPTVAALERLYRPQALDRPVLVPRDGPIAALDPSEQGIFASYVPEPQIDLAPPPLMPSLPSLTASVDAALAAGLSEPETVPDVQVVEARPPEVVLFAQSPAWVRVRAADGTILLEKILQSGERFVLPKTEQPPTLRAGNSGAVFFAVNGQTLGPAGRPGSVAKNVVLSAEALDQTYELANLDADPELARMAALVISPEEAPTAE